MEIKKYYNFNKIKKFWKYLNANNSNSTIYQTAEFNEIIWNNLLAYKIILQIRPVFFVFFENNIPILIIPLFKRILKNKYTLFGYKTGSGYLDFIHGDLFIDSSLASCINILKEKYGITNIEVDRVRNKTVLGRYAINHGCKTSNVCCTVINLPNEFSDYFDSLNKNMKQNIRTMYNRMMSDNKKFNLVVTNYSNISNDNRTKLMNIYISRQIAKYKKNKILFRLFSKYVDVATKIESNNDFVGVFILYINNEIAAFFDVLYDDKTYIVPRLAIANGFDRYSPGILLLNESIKWIITNTNIRTLDLTHGTESYKIRMGGIVQECVEGVLN